MPSIAAIQRDLKDFNQFARTHSNHGDALKKKWHSLFDTELSDTSAKSFADYYRDMRSKSRRMRGGAANNLTHAALNYSMTPGAPVQVYGNFPVGVDTDPASIRDLDVYYNDSLTKGCGTEDSSRFVPADMGTNKVGGAGRSGSRSRKSYKKHRTSGRKSYKKQRKDSRKGRNTLHRRRHRGGNLGETLMNHPYISSPPPNMIQSISALWSGSTSPVPAPSSPASHTWQYASNGLGGLINPGAITPIGSEFSKLASPPPWQTST